MIGFVGGVARTVLPQIARRFGQQAVQRLLAGEAVEDVLSQAELRQLAKDTGKLALTEFLKKGKDYVIEDYEKKNADWNARMNDFSRNLNDEFRKNTTLYKVVRNIQNKNKIEDRRGLWNAYDSPAGVYKSGSTLYISGTGGKDGSLTRDIMDDLLLLPTRNADKTEKYNDVMKELKQSPEIRILVGHSMASAVINKINQDMPDKYATTTYATPTIRRKRKGKQDPRHKDYRVKNDPVSMLDGYAETKNTGEWKILMAHSYIPFEGNGLWHINPTNSISNGISPNQPIKI